MTPPAIAFVAHSFAFTLSTFTIPIAKRSINEFENLSHSPKSTLKIKSEAELPFKTDTLSIPPGLTAELSSLPTSVKEYPKAVTTISSRLVASGSNSTFTT
jgi:hypothetical protein